MLISLAKIQRDKKREDLFFLPFEKSKPTDSKIKRFVLKKIRLPGRCGALLYSVTAPQILMSMRNNANVRKIERQRKKVGTRSVDSKIPVGLVNDEQLAWINPMNALMQFLLFLPEFRHVCLFVPRSFRPFLDFVERYLLDQQEGRSLSSANNSLLVHCLMKTLPPPLFQKAADANLYEILKALNGVLFPFLKTVLQIEWENGSLEEAVQAKKAGHFLIGVRRCGAGKCIKKQFFIETHSVCYDLRAFVERRVDGAEGASFVTYLKIRGSWYQCDDERIAKLRSDCLSIPLQQSILLYYKRIDLLPY
jgi:hypothetical protein